jgi:hypothetical protein
MSNLNFIVKFTKNALLVALFVVLVRSDFAIDSWRQRFDLLFF